MNLFQLECFLAVAGHLNFARAAEQMNISQPSISHQIQTLENELTVKLFIRSTRTVELTMEGRIFLNDAKNIVMMSKMAVSRFENPSQREILNLSIGCHGFMEFQRLPPVLRRMSAKYDNLHPRLLTFPDSALLKHVEDGLLDVALKLKTDTKKSALNYRELGKIAPVCMVCREHRLSSLRTISVKQLEDEKLILYDPVHADASIAQFQWRLAEKRAPSDLHFCESTEAALILTASGFGMFIAPDAFLPPQEMNLVSIPLADCESFSFGLYYKTCQGKPHLKDFIACMRELFFTACPSS